MHLCDVAVMENEVMWSWKHFVDNNVEEIMCTLTSVVTSVEVYDCLLSHFDRKCNHRIRINGADDLEQTNEGTRCRCDESDEAGEEEADWPIGDNWVGV